MRKENSDIMLDKLKIAVVGLGEIGLPVAVTFNEKYPVVGYDRSAAKIQSVLKEQDLTKTIDTQVAANAPFIFTSDPTDLLDVGFIIIAISSPIDENNLPDLQALKDATICVGKHMKKGAVIVYESMMAPGTTEEICMPLLEKYSGYECGKEFFVGYTPTRGVERTSQRNFKQTKKVIAGQNEEVTEFLAMVYGSVVTNGIHKAPSIRVAELAMLIENIQHDVNLALMNELALICEMLEINTQEVLETASSNQNFINITPHLGSGQKSEASIYLADKVKKLGIEFELAVAGNKINEGMGYFVAESLIKKMVNENIFLPEGRVIVLGLSTKEESHDLHQSKVIDIVKQLKKSGIDVQLSDTYAASADVENYYRAELLPHHQLQPAHAVVLAVPHRPYREGGWKQFERLLIGKQGIVFDVKGVLNQHNKPEKIKYWRL